MPMPTLVATSRWSWSCDPETERTRRTGTAKVENGVSLMIGRKSSARVRIVRCGSKGKMDDQLLLIARAMACPLRLHLLRLLGPRGLSVTDAAKQAGIAVSTASHHLARLAAAGLASRKRSGRTCMYTWPAQRLALVYTTASDTLMPETDNTNKGVRPEAVGVERVQRDGTCLTPPLDTHRGSPPQSETPSRS